MQDTYTEQQLLAALRARDGDMFDQANAMRALCSRFGYTQASLAGRLSVSQSYVGNKLRLLQYAAEEQQQIRSFCLSERHARILLRATPPQRIKLIATVGTSRLTVQQTEELVNQYASTQNDTAHSIEMPTASTDTYILQMQAGADRLRLLGHKTTCLTESGDGWHRITVTIVE